MAKYLVKHSPLKQGDKTIPIGGTIELEKRETVGLEQFLDEIPGQSSDDKPPVLNVADTVKLVLEAQSIEELDKLAEGETRKGVNDAIAKRRLELAPPQ